MGTTAQNRIRKRIASDALSFFEALKLAVIIKAPTRPVTTDNIAIRTASSISSKRTEMIAVANIIAALLSKA